MSPAQVSAFDAALVQMSRAGDPPPRAQMPSAPMLSAPPPARPAPANSPPTPWQRVALERPEGVHAVISFTVVPGDNMSLIAPRAAFPFGWAFYYSGGHEGSQLEIPGVGNFTLRNDPGAAHAYLDLVKTPAGVTILNPNDPTTSTSVCTLS
jgi:hypothetical protein